jgi:FixJ family two-component response regulator
MVVNHTVDGILLDMHMPVMNGRTMLDELRWLGYQMPVLAMSGGLDLPAFRQLLREGAQGIFLKPFNLQSLKQSFPQIFEKEGSSSSPQIPSSDIKTRERKLNMWHQDLCGQTTYSHSRCIAIPFSFISGITNSLSG